MGMCTCEGWTLILSISFIWHKNDKTCYLVPCPGWGGGGKFRISSDRDVRMGAKIKPLKKSLVLQTKPPKSLNQNSTPKKSHAEFPSHKNFQKRPEYGNYHESSDCFEYPKISYINQAAPKILAKIFLSKRNPEIENFKPKKILRSSLSLEIRSTPPPRFPAYVIFINGRSLPWYQTFTKKEHYIILTRLAVETLKWTPYSGPQAISFSSM